jgi:L-fuconolactonase
MRIDGCASLCDRARFSYPWNPHRDYTAGDLAAILTRNRFDGAVVMAQTGDPGETDWLLELAASQPWMMGVITRLTERRHWDRWQRDPKFLGVETAQSAVAAEAGRRGLVCVSPYSEAAGLLESASRLVVRATAGLSFAEDEFDRWAQLMEALGPTAAMIQIDGLINQAGPGGWRAETYRRWVQYLLTLFGPGRIMYGSGWPLSMPHATWKESLACFTQALGPRSLAERSSILGGNAAKYYPRRAGVGYTEGSPA